MPLSRRLLALNGLVVGSGAIAGSYIAVRVARESPDVSTALLVAALAVVGLVLSVGLHVVLVRWSLSPLHALETVAAHVQRGEDPGDLRVPLPGHADPELARLIAVFNDMLESLSRYRTRLRRLALAAVETTEEERRLQARVLQDDTAQHLAACLLMLGAVRATADPGRRDRALDEARDRIEEALEGVRRLARSLRPPELADVGVESALRAIGREVEERGGPRVEMDLDDLSAGFDPAVRLVLYRAAQEALLNAERHAGASTIRIELRRSDDRAIARVEDDGRGFDAGGRSRDGGAAIGLFAMAERVRSVGGVVDVESRPGGGTRVRIDLPVRPEGKTSTGSLTATDAASA